MVDKEMIEEKIKTYGDKNVPTLARGRYDRAHFTRSPATAIKAMCDQCVGYENRVAIIRGCKIYHCPLWSYRQFKEGDKDTCETDV